MITIIDYGLSNLLSIKRAVSLYEKDVIISDNPEDLFKADKIILPGVGAFVYGMNRMEQLGLAEVIREQCTNGKPLLGICLGMQMLLDSSEEGGKHDGLGLIHGQVVSIPAVDMDGIQQDVPHIGWGQLDVTAQKLEKSLFSRCNKIGEAYFVHSYEAKVDDGKDLVATTCYGGRNVAAVIQRENVAGCQFHPEKSGAFGLSLIESFIKDF